MYVFDRKPLQMKAGELEKRDKAQATLEKVEESGDLAEVDKQSRHLVKVTKKFVDDCLDLLKIMGVPYVDASCEVETNFCVIVKTSFQINTSKRKLKMLSFKIYSPKSVDHLLLSPNYNCTHTIAPTQLHLLQLYFPLELSQIFKSEI